LGELAKMLKVSGLAGKIHYNREIRQSLKKNHDNRNYEGKNMSKHKKSIKRLKKIFKNYFN